MKLNRILMCASLILLPNSTFSQSFEESGFQSGAYSKWVEVRPTSLKILPCRGGHCFRALLQLKPVTDEQVGVSRTSDYLFAFTANAARCNVHLGTAISLKMLA